MMHVILFYMFYIYLHKKGQKTDLPNISKNEKKLYITLSLNIKACNLQNKINFFKEFENHFNQRVLIDRKIARYNVLINFPKKSIDVAVETIL